MSTVKILDLPYITTLQANTSNTVLVGVDVPSDTTGQLTLTTLARGLYSNNNLYVGNGDIIFANAVGEFVGNSSEYLQVVIHNNTAEGSSDYIMTADDGDDESEYLDLGFNGSNYSDSNYSAMEAHDGYLYVQSTAPQGNLVLGTAVDAAIKFIIGGTEDTDIVGYLTRTSIHVPAIDSLITTNVATLRGEVTANAASANSVINTRISANVATLRGEITANADSANSVINTRISANVATLRGEITANADASLKNTTDTLDGNLTVTGYVESTKLIVNNASLPSNEGLIVATITNNNAIGTPSNPGYTFYSAVDGGNRIAGESYGAAANGYVGFIGRRARGTAESPTAIQSGDIILRVGGNGYGTTQFSQYADARIEFSATQNHTDSAKGTRIEFWTTANNTSTSTQIATFNGDSAVFTGAVSPQKGFIYTPRVLTGAQTAVTINFTNDSMVKFEVDDNMSIALSNYETGKVVEVWIVNLAAQNKTITHGCLATNSTSKATTFTILSGACAYLRYFSIDGDQTNTYVSINA